MAQSENWLKLMFWNPETRMAGTTPDYESEANELTLGQINDAMKGVKGFVGTFPIDKLPKKLNIGEALISNFQTAEQGGSHWVSLSYLPATKSSLPRLIYMDSFGMPPPIPILKLCHASAPAFWYTDSQYQKYTSLECGMYCVYFVTKALAGDEVEKILGSELIPHPSNANETLVKKFYQSKAK